MLIKEEGYYRDRENRLWYLSPNKTGWLDNLPWVVATNKGEPPNYTVDGDGFLYPYSHPVYRDSNGFYQLPLFNDNTAHPRQQCPGDIIVRVA